MSDDGDLCGPSHQVYIVHSDDDNRDYVGLSEAPGHRWYMHIMAARTGKSGDLYEAMRRIGPENFTVRIVGAYPNRRDAEIHERTLIRSLYDSGKNPYNHQRVAGRASDFHGDMSDPARLQLAEAVVAGGGLMKWCRDNFVDATASSRFLNGIRIGIPKDAAAALRIEKRPVPRTPPPQRTHCINDHPLTDDNVFIYARGWRGCKICKKASNKTHRERAKMNGNKSTETTQTVTT